MQRQEGFSLAEVILAMGLVAVALLALVAQNTLLLGSNQKQDNSTVAAGIAQSIMETVAVGARHDTSIRDAVYASNSVINPYDSGQQTVGHTAYDWQIFVSDVQDSLTGSPVGRGVSGTNATTLKKLEVVVTWFDPNSASNRQMGKLEVRGTRLLKVTDDS